MDKSTGIFNCIELAEVLSENIRTLKNIDVTKDSKAMIKITAIKEINNSCGKLISLASHVHNVNSSKTPDMVLRMPAIETIEEPIDKTIDEVKTNQKKPYEFGK